MKIVPIEQEKVEKTISETLAPVVCYEPWFPRCLESIKQCLNDGHPVLIRLHSAADYPCPVNECYQLDLESQAVLVVGYDDEKQAAAIIDPWNNSWGGNLGGRRWISYADLSKATVNTSLGVLVGLAPLQINLVPELDDNQNLSITANVGFYIPRGVVMDHDSWAIKKVTAQCVLPEIWGDPLSYEIDGHWIVGDCLKLSMPITSQLKTDGEVQIIIKAMIQGERPYAFNDNIEVSKKLWISAALSKQEQYSYIVV